ncbi:MAG: hypothetical protein ABR987_05180 [Terracidiphilus sp.]
MASFDMNHDREHDTVHARIAELHNHAAYEHSAANYLKKEGENEIAHEFATRACRHSMEAAELARQALGWEEGVQGMMTAAAD